MGVMDTLRKSLKQGGGAKKEQAGWNEKRTIDGYAYYYNNESEAVQWDKPKELMSKEELDLMDGSFVFVPHPTRVWQAGKIVNDLGGGSVQVQTYPDGKKETVKRGVMCDTITAGRKQKVELWSVKLSSLRLPEDDLVMLDDNNEALIINCLEARYAKDELYTWVGASRSVLISINPYKPMNIYGEEQIKAHQSRSLNARLAPHVFDIANDAYESMMYENRNQSVLISGESGAGKTVCTKQVLDFLAHVAGSANKLEGKILECNPLLEAFGNAQTIRNNNSSRFGKWIEVHFDAAEKVIRSASITNYLLEKSRVVRQQAASRERNYHIFYQLCKDPAARAELQLGAPEEYAYLNSSGTFDAKDIDDVREHAAVRHAMQTLDFTADEVAGVMRLVAGVLNIGQVEYKPREMPGRVTGSEVADLSAAQRVADLFEVEVADLANVLTSRSISVKGKTSVIPLDPSKARSGAEALAMGVYSRLFSWLVRRVNDALGGPSGKMIGILDIFGFEIFDNNSFEQLCLNYANEKLQQQFNQTTFKEEEALYSKQGIKFKRIEFIDNQVVLDLIEARHAGLLPMIDDETVIPEGADSKFMNKAEAAFAKHPKFQTDKNRKLTDKLNFEIEHYAGVVNYNADGFVVKNLDTLFQDLYDLCGSSRGAIMVSIFKAEATRRQLVSLGKQFRGQLGALMKSLVETESRYIRCVKPNAEQRPDQFKATLVLDQLRYSGVFEAVDIRRQGYPFRLSYAQFQCRYACVNRGAKYAAKRGDHAALCREILAKSKQDFAEVQMGKTLVLYRAKEHKLLQLLRNLALETLIPRGQAAVRAHLVKELARRLRAAEARIAAAIKKGCDLPAMEAAVAGVEPALGAFRRLFPDYLPRNLKAGQAHLAGLKRWAALEGKLGKLVTQDANKVYYALAEAVDEGVRLRREFNFPTREQEQLVNKAIELRANSDLGKIDAEAERLLPAFDRERTEALLERAQGFKHSTPQLKELQHLLLLPLREWYALEIEAADKAGDERRKIACQVELKAIEIEEDEDKYSNLRNYPKVRQPEDYANSTAFLGFGKAGIAKNMLNHTKRQKDTLTAIADPADKAAVRAAKKKVRLTARLIRQYMGEAGAKSAADAAAQFLREGQGASNDMRDEMYLQIVKQMRNTKKPENTPKARELMLLACGAFAPGNEAEKFVLVFLKRNASEDIPYQRFVSALNETIYSKGVSPNGVEVAARLTELKESKGSRFSTKRKGNRKSKKH